MLRSINRHGGALAQEATAAYRNLLAELEGGLPARAVALDIKVWQSIRSRADVKKQIAERLQTWMRERVLAWQDTTLKTLFEARLGAMEADLNEQARSFLDNLRVVRTAFTPEVPVALDGAEENVSPLSRVAGAAGGLLIGGIGSAVEGASLGVTHRAKGLGLHLAIGYGLAVLGFGLPVIIPVLAVAGLLRTFLGARQSIERLRADTVKAVVAALRAKQPEVEQELRTQLIAHFRKLFETVSAGLSLQIDEVRGQTQAVVREREAQESAAGQGLTLLQQVLQELAGYARQLLQLRAEIEAN
jgi:hypothetical protein